MQRVSLNLAGKVCIAVTVLAVLMLGLSAIACSIDSGYIQVQSLTVTAHGTATFDKGSVTQRDSPTITTKERGVIEVERALYGHQKPQRILPIGQTYSLEIQGKIHPKVTAIIR